MPLLSTGDLFPWSTYSLTLRAVSIDHYFCNPLFSNTWQCCQPPKATSDLPNSACECQINNKTNRCIVFFNERILFHRRAPQAAGHGCEFDLGPLGPYRALPIIGTYLAARFSHMFPLWAALFSLRALPYFPFWTPTGSLPSAAGSTVMWWDTIRLREMVLKSRSLGPK